METKSLSLKSQSGHYAHIDITVAFASINIASTATITVRTNSMELANTSAIAYSNIIAIFVTTATRTIDISVVSCIMVPKDIQVLIPGTCKYYLIWQKVL